MKYSNSKLVLSIVFITLIILVLINDVSYAVSIEKYSKPENRYPTPPTQNPIRVYINIAAYVDITGQVKWYIHRTYYNPTSKTLTFTDRYKHHDTVNQHIVSKPDDFEIKEEFGDLIIKGEVKSKKYEEIIYWWETFDYWDANNLFMNDEFKILNSFYYGYDPRPFLSGLTINVYFSEPFIEKYDYKESTLNYKGYKTDVYLKPSIIKKGHLGWEIITKQMINDYGIPYVIDLTLKAKKRQFGLDTILINLSVGSIIISFVTLYILRKNLNKII
jgi:hypothetical protein